MACTIVVGRRGQQRSLANWVAIEVRDEKATVTVDGKALVSLTLDDPQLVAGQVQLGAVNDADSGDAQAAFTHVELRSTTVGTPPKFADLTTGSRQPVVGRRSSVVGRRSSVVKLSSYDPRFSGDQAGVGVTKTSRWLRVR